MSDVKNFTPMDMALLRRVATQTLSLHIAEVVEQKHILERAVLGAVGIKTLGRPTFVMRDEDIAYVGQMIFDEHFAHITMLAPQPKLHDDISPWLALIENMIWQAGRRGATHVVAEVPVNSEAFTIFRRTAFSVYSRERLFCLPMSANEDVSNDDSLDFEMMSELHIRPIEDADTIRLNALRASTVPQMVQQVCATPESWDGFAIVLGNRLLGGVSVAEGKDGILLRPYLHPELFDLTDQIFRLVLDEIPKRPVFVRVHAYQDWLRHTLEDTSGFQEVQRYALMARFTAVQKGAAHFSPFAALEKAFPANIEVAMETVLNEKQ